MGYEIIYVCDSVNNKNIRQGELNILEKNENQLCFEFGSDRMNIKKRFYNDIETLNKDFDNLLKLKEKEENEDKEIEPEEVEEVKEVERIKEVEEVEEIKAIKKATKQSQKKNKEEKSDTEDTKQVDKYKIIKRKK